MREPYPYGHLASYPHMKPNDVAIWDRYIDAYPDAYDRVYYDLDVGEGPPFSAIVNDATGGHDVILYKKKIDVVGIKNDRVCLIEIKPQAGANALGQILLYEHLYRKHENPNAKIDLKIITDFLKPDVAGFAEEYEIDIVVI